MLNGNSPPFWASLDSDNNKLILNTPNVSSDTSYSFSIDSYIDGNSSADQKPIFLKVSIWNPVNCIQWEEGSQNLCKSCEEKYQLISNKNWVKIEDEQKSEEEEEENKEDVSTETTAMQAAAIASMVLATSTAIINLSSPSGLWLVFNQYKLLLLLLLTGAYFPEPIVEFITGMNFTLFSFDFLASENTSILKEAINSINKLRSWSYSKQGNPFLLKMGLESSSCFYNTFITLLILLLIVLFHLWYSTLYWKIHKKMEKDNKWYKVLTWLFYFFTMAVYIRIMLESHQLFMIAIWSEFRHFSLHSSSDRISFAFSTAFLGFLIWFMIFWGYIWKKGINNSFKGYMKYFTEIFAGIKMKNLSRFWVIFAILRRKVIIMFLVFLG